MNILNTVFINIRKLKIKTKNAMFLILPISILVVFSVIITSQVKNIREASSVSIFNTIKDQSRIINLTKDSSQSSGGFGGGMMQMMDSSDRTFNEGDLYTIQSIDGVESAQLSSSIPITNVKTSDLFDDKTVNIQNLTGLNDEFSSIYTNENFDYVAGQEIPIILNASTFIESYEDWQGKTEFSMDFRSLRDSQTEGQDPRALMETLSPIKTKSIGYDKASLIGKMIVINFGGLDDIESYTMDRGDSSPVMKKLTEDEIQAKKDARKTAISKYWNYDTISSPTSYTFKVVGVIEDSTNQSSYVPSAFVDELMKAYIQHEIDSKSVATISSDVLNSTFTGLSYDGTELTESMDSMIMGGMRGGRFGMQVGNAGHPEVRPIESESVDYTQGYEIPGLVIEVSNDGKGTVVGEYLNTSVYTEASKTSTDISILLESITGRGTVIEKLNDLGYAYQDLSNMEVFAELENTLVKFSSTFMLVFIALIAGLVIITVGKFVSDSKKEIGIFRAIGVTKGGIMTLFLSQSLIYAFVGLIIGLSTGILGNLLISGIVNTWFTNFVNDTVAGSFNIVAKADASIFRNINWGAIGAYSAILSVITFITSLIPAYNASSVSPVEAIRND